MKKALAAALLAMSLASPAQAAQAPLCRDARPGADRFTRHLVNEWTIDASDRPRSVRFHDCGRWRGNPSRLWFRYTAHDPLLGPIRWWVRASWHGTFWHYYNQGLGIPSKWFTPQP